MSAWPPNVTLDENRGGFEKGLLSASFSLSVFFLLSDCRGETFADIFEILNMKHFLGFFVSWESRIWINLSINR